MSKHLSDTYLDRICRAVVEELNDASDGELLRRIEWAANFDFWVAEIEHCLQLLDGSIERRQRSVHFREHYPMPGGPRNVEAMRASLQSSVANYTRHRHLRRSELNHLRADLHQAAEKLLQHCVDDKLINKATRRSTLRRLKIK